MFVSLSNDLDQNAIETQKAEAAYERDHAI